ncbi:holo-ACP synthase [Cryobacterium frigoriphilum]|uniref:Holo-[acyl-carrier-protein] synthase n=1 Tax=Cryobacterium frigoriphilum TaxID=1259150 RepID=A0A4R9A444_9MICO|nr:holo-ACP synthase [Cryobacterium frigoriphilum]TFD51678.1 holo-ACP synthase [Cryobacterium frigoriphilum]
MIVGIGVDVVDLARFARQVDRTPALIPRLFAESERGLSVHSLAARFAAKEALIKALGHSGSLLWRDMEIVSDEHGNPGFVRGGALAAALTARGIDRVHVTMTHDAGVACAFVVAESDR